MKTAVIYARYSCSSQTEQSIEGQMTVCNQFAANNDVQIVGTYIDRATTGTNDNRVEFQKMLADSAKATWDLVLVYAIDRFGRNSIEIAVNKQRLLKNNKILISATQKMSMNIDGTKNLDGIILENVMIGVAEYYSAELSQKIARGLNESRKKGLYCGGGVPFGYKVKDKKIYIDEEKAPIVRYIFERYSMGIANPEILNDLMSKGITKNGKPFTQNGLYNLLKNDKYAGIFMHNKEALTNIYPPIVSDEIYQAVKRKFAANKTGKQSDKIVSILRGKVICGYCGNPISTDCGTAKKGQLIRYYACRGKKRLKNGCTKTTVRKEFLDNAVLNEVIERLKTKEFMDEAIKNILKVQSETKQGSDFLKQLLKEKIQIETSINNLVTAVEQGVFTASTKNRLQELETRLAEVDKTIVVEKCKESPTLTEAKIREYYEKALRKEPMMIISLLVKQIILYDDKMIIKLNSPLQKDPDESRGLLLYKNKITLKRCIYHSGKHTDEIYDLSILI